MNVQSRSSVRSFKYLVIGRGIMGSAAAMHLASASEGVAVLGPTEAMADTAGTVPKASHYDAGRVTRIADPDPFWSGVAKRSIDRYRDLEEATGIKFFNEAGFMWADNDAQRSAATFEMTRNSGGVMSRLNPDEVQSQFPYFNFESGVDVLFQEGNGGTINPRGYVGAMTERAKQLGAEVIDGHATAIDVATDGVTVTTDTGEIKADQVMIATGAYGAFDGLSPVSVPLKTNKHTVVLIEVPEAVAEGDLANMPSLMSQPPGDRIGTYTLPPLRYPDGKFYLKIGIEGPRPPVDSLDSLNAWFRSGDDADLNRQLIEELQIMMPSLNTSSWSWLACITTDTPDRRPVIGLVADGKVCLQLGGNGYSAKSGDAIGELGASLLLGKDWPGPVPADELSPERFGSDSD